MWVLPEKMEWQDEAYLACVGRALFICQKLETAIKSIGFLAEYKLLEGGDDKDGTRSGARWARANARNERKELSGRIEITCRAFLSDNEDLDHSDRVSRIFRRAKNSRNFIAHESRSVIIPRTMATKWLYGGGDKCLTD